MVEPVQIPLTKGHVALIDQEDADLAGFKWTAAVSKKTRVVYAYRLNPAKRPAHLRLHRLIMERILGRPLQDTELVDHANRNGLDNRRANLRLASKKQNQINRGAPSNNTSGFKEVHWNKSKWQVSIGVDGRTIFIGKYHHLCNAVIAYNEAAISYYGEFAALNDVPPIDESFDPQREILRRTNTSGFKGVYWNKRLQKWTTRIQVNGESIHLGVFTSLRHAVIAYNEAALKHFGDRAILNKIPDTITL